MVFKKHPCGNEVLFFVFCFVYINCSGFITLGMINRKSREKRTKEGLQKIVKIQRLPFLRAEVPSSIPYCLLCRYRVSCMNNCCSEDPEGLPCSAFCWVRFTIDLFNGKLLDILKETSPYKRWARSLISWILSSCWGTEGMIYLLNCWWRISTASFVVHSVEYFPTLTTVALASSYQKWH